MSASAEGKGSEIKTSSGLSKVNGKLKPVAFVEPILNLSERSLPASNLLLSPLHRTQTAAVGMARVHVARGAAAFIVNDGSSICILSLHETKQGDVQILANKTKAFVWDFSLPSALASVKTLNSLKNSDRITDRNLFGKIVKNAVALQVLTMNRGVFQKLQ